MSSIYYSFVLIFCASTCVGGGDVCPKQCDCDMEDGLNRAMCVDQNIIGIDVGVPKGVQIYSLRHNVISELENFCFKEVGYTSIQVLDLSYNLIFWIGLHAFAGLDNLVHLDISNNRLRYISSDLFWDTPQLDILDLSGNVFEKLKNEPIIMHKKLQVLNLSNCRIISLPERMFSRLPNLKKLDLSENYMSTLSAQVLRPLRKLERLQLRNDYWQCNPQFMAIEAWIESLGVVYEKQCRKKLLTMSEKIISLVVDDKEEVEINEVWNVTENNKSNAIPTTEYTTPISPPITPLQKFDRNFSAIQALIIGLELGIAIGIVATYIWLRGLCTRGRLTCSRPQTRRQRRRIQRAADNDMRTNLLWGNAVTVDTETPPAFRREIPLPETVVPVPTYGFQSTTTEAALQIDAIRLPSRSETPPPPYHELCVN